MELARVQCAFELCEPVAAVAVAGQDRGQVREVVEVDVRVACVLLIGRDAAGLCAEGAFAEEFDRAETRVVQVDARGQSLHAVHDQVEVGERHGSASDATPRVEWSSSVENASNGISTSVSYFLVDRRR